MGYFHRFFFTVRYPSLFQGKKDLMFAKYDSIFQSWSCFDNLKNITFFFQNLSLHSNLPCIFRGESSVSHCDLGI